MDERKSVKDIIEEMRRELRQDKGSDLDLFLPATARAERKKLRRAKKSRTVPSAKKKKNAKKAKKAKSKAKAKKIAKKKKRR